MSDNRVGKQSQEAGIRVQRQKDRFQIARWEIGWTKVRILTRQAQNQKHILIACQGDRIQWFRAEAEMQRWQEEVERMQAKFMRCIRSFSRMEDAWMNVATSAPDKAGHAAYAKRQAAMWARMKRECRMKFTEAGYSPDLEKGEILADRVAAVREADAKLFAIHIGSVQV